MKVTGNDAGPQKAVRKKPGRAPVSCAECRRLKMKCDRGNPCENCTKRGCSVICPDGTLTTGKNNKMILSNTEELHDRIEALLERIRLLEDALRVLQSSASSEPHPLLTAPTTESILSAIHDGPSRGVIVAPRVSKSAKEEDSLDSFGTLSVGSDGETSYLGQTAQADYFLDDSDSDCEPELGRLPKSFYGYCWPECPPPDNAIEETVLSYLPDLTEAYLLCDIYCSISSWFGFLIPRETVREDFIAHVYHLHGRPWADTLPTCPHRLALLFSIFSLGSLFDPARQVNNVESDDYYHLSRVALSFKSAVLEPTVHAVLAIIHMAYIVFLRDTADSREQAWVMLGTAHKLALSMGLHRDSSHWRLDKELSELRHTTFWQLYVIECLASVLFGRPTLLSDSFIECPLPRHLLHGESQSKYPSWVVQFSRVARRILSEAFAAKAIPYASLLELDSDLRGLGEPDWQSSGYATGAQVGPDEEKLQRWVVVCCREIVLLSMHRGYLLAALNDESQELSSSKYSRSVQACFESSSQLIDGMVWITNECPHASSRVGSWYGASISAAVIMCIFVTRCPTSEFARPAMERLEYVYASLQKASNINRTVKKDLKIARRLRELGRAAVSNSRLAAHGSVPSQAASAISTEDASTLERCSGKTHLRTRKERTVRAPDRRHHRDILPSLTSEQGSVQSWNERMTKLGGTAVPPGTSSSGDDSVRLALSGETIPSGFGHGLDPTWHAFIEQLGF